MAADFEHLVAIGTLGNEALLDTEELVLEGEELVALHIGKV